jgi:exodeoxyribonuclease VIII
MRKIYEPGTYPEMSEEEYLSVDLCSASRLKIQAERSLLHVKYDIDNRAESTDAQTIGSAVHHAILQPEKFGELYVQAPEVDRRTKEGKATYQSFLDESGDRIPLKAETYNQCREIASSVSRNRDARAFLEEPGEVELSLIIDTKEGLRAKARLDKLCPRLKTVIDIKTTTNASPKNFGREIYNFGYHRQAAMYLSACEALKLPAVYYVIIAVEKEAPYVPCVYRLSRMAIDLGKEEIEKLMPEYGRAHRSGVWPGYPENAVTIDVPDWAYKVGL